MYKEPLNVDQVIALINQRCDKFGQQKLYAKKCKISQEHLSKALNKKVKPAHKILEDLGLIEVVMYVRKKAD